MLRWGHLWLRWNRPIRCRLRLWLPKSTDRCSERKPTTRSMADRLRDFTRMNPPIFVGSKTSDDHQELVDEVHKILVSMRATYTKKAELASYQLKDVAHTWCKIWQDNCILGWVSVTWELLKTTFLERFFSREMREAKVEKFINLKQGSMTV